MRLSTQYDHVPLSAAGIRRIELWASGRPARPFQLTDEGYLMKKLIAVMITGLFAVAGAFADEMKKDEKKAEAKPAAEAKKTEAKKEEKKGEMKKAEMKKTDAKKEEMKTEMKKEEKKDDTKKEAFKRAAARGAMCREPLCFGTAKGAPWGALCFLKPGPGTRRAAPSLSTARSSGPFKGANPSEAGTGRSRSVCKSLTQKESM